jgi:23S rRNA pseudouridine1911/1915/1917 synthase
MLDQEKLISIVFENNDFAVINKPAGLLVHSVKLNSQGSKTGKQEPTLANWIINRFPQASQIIDPVSSEAKYGLVHRLDKETSGIMVITKTQPAFNDLKHLFQTHSLNKTYRALLIGSMPKIKGTIDLAIANAKQGTKRTTKIRPQQTSREALTDYRVLNSYTDPTINPGQVLSDTELLPKTGRTHQIRVHCAAIGHPIVGDYLYGGKISKAYRPALGRMFLHAYSLEFNLKGTNFHFEADLPEALTDFLKKLHPLK